MRPVVTAALFLVACYVGPGAWAQVTVENAGVIKDTAVHTAPGVVAPVVVSTDTVDFFSRPQGKPKSANLAMGASLLLPGLGHSYMGRKRTALAYITADAAAIFGYIFCNHFSKRIAVDAAGYAGPHAFVQGSISGPDDYFWSQVGAFTDVDEYNRVMELERTPEKKFYSQNQYWHWDDPSSQSRFNAMRATSRKYQVVGSFFLGALVLNRIIAFIDIRATTRHQETMRTTGAALQVQPMVSFTPKSVDFTLAGSF